MASGPFHAAFDALRNAAKAVMRLLAYVSVLHWAFTFYLSTCIGNFHLAFVKNSQRAAQWPGLWGVYRRRGLLRLMGARAAHDCHIEYGALLSKHSAVIASGAYVGAYCCLGDVRIGAKAMIADGVHIPSGGSQHSMARLDIPMADQPGRLKTVTVGLDCWIGSRAVVLADVGDHAVVAAGAVVTRPVEPFAVVAGVPAQVIGDRRESAQTAHS